MSINVILVGWAFRVGDSLRRLLLGTKKTRDMADPTDSNPKVETPGGEKDKKPIKRGVLPNAPNLTSSGRDRRPTQVDITKDVQALRINDEVTREAEAAPIDDRRSSQESGLVIEGVRTSYDVTKKSGKGSFGVVYQAVERDTQNVVAIKRVLQDPRYKVCKLNSNFCKSLSTIPLTSTNMGLTPFIS